MAEIARAAAFRSCAARRLFVGGRLLCRNVIGRLLDCAPAALSLTITPSGRPHLPDYPDIDFNLSHTEDRVLLAICHGGRVGVDIERVDALSAMDAREIMPLLLSKQEFGFLQELTPRQRQAAMLSCWVRKEAALKCLGDGFLADPKHLMITADIATYGMENRSSGVSIFLRSGQFGLDEGTGFEWAIATSKPNPPPVWHDYTPADFIA
ncbi:MAG: 4'-phosphopantetheinyl transferase superfamily protein [Rhizobium sp.]|nr:MAG: 4'-phosphopantetheinyl transferase superfamily protein [Rhizobium sp.]